VSERAQQKDWVLLVLCFAKNLSAEKGGTD
jgi:hypothetical protein